MSEHKFSILPGRAVTDARLTDSIMRTLAALCMYANTKTGWCFPKQSTLAENVGKSRQTVNEHIKLLVEWGYLGKVSQFREDGSQKASAYQVLYDTPVSSLETTPPVNPRLDSNNDPMNDPNNIPAGENSDKPSTPNLSPLPENLPIEWQIVAGQKEVYVPDDKDAARKDVANMISMGTGSMSQMVAALAYAFMSTRGIIIPDKKVKGNRAKAVELVKMGVKPEHVIEATQKLMKNKMTVTDLYSIEKTAVDLANPAPETYDGAIEGV